MANSRSSAYNVLFDGLSNWLANIRSVYNPLLDGLSHWLAHSRSSYGVLPDRLAHNWSAYRVLSDGLVLPKYWPQRSNLTDWRLTNLLGHRPPPQDSLLLHLLRFLLGVLLVLDEAGALGTRQLLA